MPEDFSYQGTELSVFAQAVTWKRYFLSHIRPFLRGRVLEVGAGMGSNTRLLFSGDETHWTCLEPDHELAQQLRQAAAREPAAFPAGLQIVAGFVEEVALRPAFDTILYIDVLEHIADDRRELAQAAQRLEQGGHLIVISPALPCLYSPFDAAIGHFRRYRRKTLLHAAPSEVAVVRLRYLDSVGMLASWTNRWLLRSAVPNPRQITFWDRVLVPLSKWVDPVCGYRVGKSLLAVWQKPTASGAARSEVPD
jgi:SAM-dependent methyltransferase